MPSGPEREPLPAAFVQQLRDILDREGTLLTHPADTWCYGYDNSRRHVPPEAVALPSSHQEVAAIIRLCNRFAIPITPRGRATGTPGGAVPVCRGLVLSTERMSRILEYSPGDRYLIAEPGVINATLQERLRKDGFFWAPDPTSAAFCTIGGNLAYNSAGPRAVKYGTPRENTLGLRAVTGAGEEIRTGVRTSKGVVGYDLTRLLIGSEGTLAVITEATLKLTPLPETTRTLRALYRDIHAAAAAVSRIMAQPVTPSSLEFMDNGAIEMIRNHSKVDIPPDTGALLMIQVDGIEAAIDTAADLIKQAAEGTGTLSVETARTPEETKALWSMRKALSPALRSVAPKKINEDVVVPVSRMAEFIDRLDRLGSRHEITIINFGHAGNGNIHVNLLVDPEDKAQLERAARCLDDLFSLVLELGGTLSGEHGIGLEKKAFIAREIGPVELDLMRRIKREFDPAGILNPGKQFPADDAGQ